MRQRIDIQQGESLTIGLQFQGISAADITELVCCLGTFQKTFNQSQVSTQTDEDGLLLVAFPANATEGKTGKLEFSAAFKTASLGVFKSDVLLYVAVHETANNLTGANTSQVARALVTLTVSDDATEVDVTLLSAFRGYSAYEIAVQNGFEGSEQEWLDSLGNDPENPGADGRTILNGTGAPSAGTGSNGDFYINTSNWTIYGPKTAGSWGSPTSIVGPQGAQGNTGNTGAAGADGKTILNGAGAPSAGLGVNGDFYINTSNWTIYGPKTAGAWGSPQSIVGPQGAQGNTGNTGAAGADGKTVLNGAGAPSAGLGVNGDFYINISNWTIYGPKTAGAWGSATSIVGPQGAQGNTGNTGAAGADGKTVLNGAGAPSAGLGVNGDFYINTTNWTIYGPKTAGAWGSPTSMVGPQGAQGNTGNTGAAGADGKTVLNGAGAPSAGLGVNGDFYINTTNWTIYGPKTAGAWGSATSIVGPQGAQGNTGNTGAAGADGRTILNGSGAPAGGTGANGDFYIDTGAWTIYGPKTAGAWGSGTSLIGPPGSGGGGGTVLSPAQITAWVNNYSPSSWANTVGILRINSNAFHFITGIAATSDGHVVRILNTGTFPIGLYNENVDSTAANRFSFDDHDVIILPTQSVTLFYDDVSDRWRLAESWALNENSPFVSRYWNELYSISNDDHGTLFNVSGNAHYADDSATEIGNRSGIVALTTSTGTTNRAFFYPSNNTGLRFDDGTGKNYMEFRGVFKTPAALSDGTNTYSLEIGFIDNVTSGTNTDACFLFYRHDTNSGNWSRCTANGGSQTTTDTGVAVTANTWYTVRCVLYPNGTAEYFINAVSAGRNTANIPGSSGVAFTFGSGIRKSAGATERILKLDGIGYTIVKYRK